jgi:hypothetical protein
MRSHPRLAALCATVIGLTTIAGPVAAADPSFSVDILGSKPLEVSEGQVVAYPVRIAGVDNRQTINHVWVDAGVPGARYLGATTTMGSCASSVAECQLGTFRPTTTPALVVFMFVAPTDHAIAALTATVTVHTGEGTNDTGHSAHPDQFSATAHTNVHHGAATTFFSRYVVSRAFDPAETGVVQTDPKISAANPHATKVVIPNEAVTAFGAPVTLSEALVAPNADCHGFPCFGQTSFISVADGTTFATGFVASVTFGRSEQPSTMRAKNLHIIHNFDGGGWEAVDTKCGATPVAPCRLSTVTLHDKSIVVTMLLKQNGNIKGY